MPRILDEAVKQRAGTWVTAAPPVSLNDQGNVRRPEPMPTMQQVFNRARQLGLALCRTHYHPDDPCDAPCDHCYQAGMDMLMREAWRNDI